MVGSDFLAGREAADDLALVVRSTLEGGLTGGFRTGGRTEDAIGLAGDDEGEACRGASFKVTVLVKVIGASMEGLRWDR